MERLMKLGVFGGTFDPVHYGHLLLAECCREQCELDEVWFVPAYQPPPKDDMVLDGVRRAEMLELATAGDPGFRVNRLELERGGSSFTVDTLQQLRDLNASHDLFLLMGADSLRALSTWREPQRIAELSTIVVVNRGDRPLPDRDEAEPGPGSGRRLRSVTMPGIDLSATEIRSRVRTGRSIRFMVPRAVEQYIREHGLYTSEA